jgi:oligopeptide transport system substrate-binding protein
MKNRHLYVGGSVLVATSVLLAACASPTPQVVEKVVEKVVTSAPQVVQQTVVVKETVAAPTAAPKPAAAKPLRINLGAFPDNIDPQKASFVNEIAHLKLIYEGLSKYNEKLETVPGAAEKWESNKDGTEWNFILRKGLKYSDGTPLNAKRFEYSIIRNINPETAGEYGTITNEVVGAEDWQDNFAVANDAKEKDAAKKAKAAEAAKKGEESVRKSVVALDSQKQPCKDYKQEDCLTLQFKLKQPAPYWPTIMGLWVTFPAKEESINNGTFKDWFNYPKFQVGNGPMVMSSLEPFQRAKFTPNKNYYAGVAKIDIEYSYITDSAVAFQAYKSGDFDVIGLAAEDLGAVNNDAVLKPQAKIYPGSCTTGLQFRNFTKPFDDPKVRQSFSYAIDRDRWVKDVLKDLGAPALTWIPPGYPGFKQGETRFKYNKDSAMKSLAESSYKEVKALPPIVLSFGDNPRNRTRYEWLAARFKEVYGNDLKIELKPVEPTAFTALQKDKNSGLQMFIGGWCADYPDQQNWLSVYFNSKTTFAQRIGYKNDNFDKLTQQADVELDAKKRADLYQQAQDVLVSDQPIAFFWNNVNSYLVSPKVKGIKTTPQDSGWPGEIDVINLTIE